MGSETLRWGEGATITRIFSPTFYLVCFLLLVRSSFGFAQEQSEQETGETILIEGSQGGLDGLVSERPDSKDRFRGLHDGHFVSVRRVNETKGENLDLPRLLASSAGVKTRSLGGLGSFTSISVRGASSGHTQIIVDGVTLSQIASVTTDLSQFDLDGFSEVEVYRGGVPAELGTASIGGAVLLRSKLGRRKRPLSVAFGGGSFGYLDGRLRLSHGTSDNRWSYLVSLGGRRSDGAFSYFSDNGTPLNLVDDSTQLRTNNQYRQLSGNARGRYIQGQIEFESGIRVAHRRQGVSGSANSPSRTASLETTTAIGDAHGKFVSPLGVSKLRLESKAVVFAEQQRFRDVDGEVGLASQDNLNRTISGGVQFLGHYRSQFPLLAILDAGGDFFNETNDLSSTPRSSGKRLRFGGALSAQFEKNGWGVEPSLRLDGQITKPSRTENPGGQQLRTVRQFLFSPRAVATWRVHDNFSIKGSLGRYFRAPTVLELFGDRGFVIGNPGLRAESGESMDIGFVWAPANAVGILDRIFVEGVGFGRLTRDTLVLAARSGLVASAANIGKSRVYGGEFAFSSRIARTVTLAGNYTVTRALRTDGEASLAGKTLPRQPLHQWYLRVDGATKIADRLLIGWADLSIASPSFLDDANLRRVPVRRFAGMGLKFELWPQLIIGAEIRNLADQRTEQEVLSPPPRQSLTRISRSVTDIAGFPLPGRSFFLRIEWEPKL